MRLVQFDDCDDESILFLPNPIITLLLPNPTIKSVLD